MKYVFNVNIFKLYVFKFVLCSIIFKNNNGENIFFEGGINILGDLGICKGVSFVEESRVCLFYLLIVWVLFYGKEVFLLCNKFDFDF